MQGVFFCLERKGPKVLRSTFLGTNNCLLFQSVFFFFLQIGPFLSKPSNQQIQNSHPQPNWKSKLITIKVQPFYCWAWSSEVRLCTHLRCMWGWVCMCTAECLLANYLENLESYDDVTWWVVEWEDRLKLIRFSMLNMVISTVLKFALSTY